jgi:hypothetical protein
MNVECRHCIDAAAFLADELTPHERAAFESHLSTCPSCRDAVESTRQLLSRLHAVPPVELKRDLTPSILARLHEPEKMPRQTKWPRFAAVAALFAVFATTLAVHHALKRREPDARATARVNTNTADALEWLVRAQEPDGSWSAERWGGQRNYTPALTALPLLAIITAEGSTPERENAAARAAANLLALQNADGSFGHAFQGSPYNQSITTLALLHAWQRYPDVVPKSALDLAVAQLAVQQTPEGGWGYRFSPFGDRSITQWHIQALDLAAKLGWAGAQPVLERGLAWLAMRSTTPDEAAEPADSTSALLARATARPARTNDALDLYQAYFDASALRHVHTPAAQERLANLRKKILKRQITEGDERGSWPPDDQWGRAGGRLYSTALASLSLANS